MNYTITEKKRRKKNGKKEDASHVSKQHDSDNFFANCNDTFINKTMTSTFSYIRNNETTYSECKCAGDTCTITHLCITNLRKVKKNKRR